jgi:mannose-6-phosphate isomerase-like protein (cupin superfamily)
MKLFKKICEIDKKDLVKIETVNGVLWIKRYFREPAGNIAVEDFTAGQVFKWSYWHDEVHYIIKGKAEITFSMPPFHQTEEKIVAETGDAYMIYKGESLTFRVISKEPFRHLCIIMPAIPTPSGDHLVLDQMQKSTYPGDKKK